MYMIRHLGSLQVYYPGRAAAGRAAGRAEASSSY
jgi:hypothetical protein